ncbi:MAG TPA: hypothetical protein VF045_03050, partial [Acidimicrobiales bacterium]
MGQGRCDVHDAALAPPAHPGNGQGGQVHGRNDQGLELAKGLVGADVDHLADVHVPGVVDHRPRVKGGDDPLARRMVGDVEHLGFDRYPRLSG